MTLELRPGERQPILRRELPRRIHGAAIDVWALRDEIHDQVLIRADVHPLGLGAVVAVVRLAWEEYGDDVVVLAVGEVVDRLLELQEDLILAGGSAG